MKALIVVLATAVFTSTSVFAAVPQPLTDFHKTLSAASQQQKMGFVLLGRATCGNCNATKAMIKDGKISVTDEDYAVGYLNVDDPKTESEFTRKFGKEKFGEMLPFVVVTDPKGKVLASSGGFKSADQWNALLAEAKSKVAKAPDVAGSKPGAANWPFKTPAKP